MGQKFFYDYNTFLRTKFGEKVYKISLDAGFTCPNRDGTVGNTGCIYCNNASFSPPVYHRTPNLNEQIQRGIETGHKNKTYKFIAYFQAYTNTYASIEKLQEIYSCVLQFPEIVGIAIGTRPDAIDKDKLDLLEQLAKTTFVSIEYGVQSCQNETLVWIQRGHTYKTFLQAMEYTRNRGIHICAHIMIGFPNETREHILQTAFEMNRVGINGIKLHNLLIVANTELEIIYHRQPFHLLSKEEYVSLVCDFLERLDPHIVCERLYATAPADYLIAPKWPLQVAMGDEVSKELAHRQSYQGKLVAKN